ncbi:glutaminase A [Helicovermis profundi]|uniref:Glutaminase n=1 Tax=Helicovermis profundi TaxID=3065157 RepID=A0AAU9E350_9FIRM|nr:glutaminase A [Clostridia bacterium S502]
MNLNELVNRNKEYTKHGNVANYIPELSKANPNCLGVAVAKCGESVIAAGDSNIKFTIQSISKPLILIMALLDYGEEIVFSKVGKEPTGDSFNSIRRLETINEFTKPYNPMINAGAIAISSLIKGKSNNEKIERILNFIRKLSNNNDIKINMDVYLSEKRTGNKNRAMAYFLKDIGILEGDVEEILDLYFMHCSIEADIIDLANIARVLACAGKDPLTNEVIIPRRIVQIVNTLMTTCGMYDESGEFAVNVGLPSKSGVGGGIMTVVPGKMGIAVYAPALDKKGNSVAGVKLLEDISNEYNLSIY